MLPAPVLTRHGRYWVVRDDLLPGGTKVRAVLPLMAASPVAEFIYAGPAQGYAQLALALCARRLGRRAAVFTAARRELHPVTLAAQAAGARIVQVQYGRLSVVRARALAYAQQTGAELLPFGLDVTQCLQSIAAAARTLPVSPVEVWTVAGSGVLTRALQLVWPQARFNAVLVGRQGCDTGNARRGVYDAPFDTPARISPPFPSVPTYDAKGWEVMEQERAPEGALFWNVAG
jgi:hypothetical protein